MAQGELWEVVVLQGDELADVTVDGSALDAPAGTDDVLLSVPAKP